MRNCTWVAAEPLNEVENAEFFVLYSSLKINQYGCKLKANCVSRVLLLEWTWWRFGDVLRWVWIWRFEKQMEAFHVGAMAWILYYKVVKVEIMSTLEKEFGWSEVVMKLHCSSHDGKYQERERAEEVGWRMRCGWESRERGPSMCKGQRLKHTRWFWRMA